MREVVTALILKDRKLFMTKRLGKEECYAGKWMFPGGHIKENEMAFEALKRELKEGLGIDIRHGLQCRAIADIDPTSGRGFRHHIFIVKDWKGQIKACTKAEKVGWFSKEKIKDIDTFPVAFLMLGCLK